MSLPRSTLVAIAAAVIKAGGDKTDAHDLAAVWERLERDLAPRIDAMRWEATRPTCCCQGDALLDDGCDGRCRRCWGWPR